MTQRIAINGFGRIGRTVLRAWCQQQPPGALEIVAINEIADPDTVAHLARYDSTHGRFPGTITHTTDTLNVDDRAIVLLGETDISALPWNALAIDIVLECTGTFSDRATAEQHLSAGAGRVLFSQPAESDVDATIVWGGQRKLPGRRRQHHLGGLLYHQCPVSGAKGDRRQLWYRGRDHHHSALGHE